MKFVSLAALVAIISGVGYLLAPILGLDASSWLFGSLVCGVVLTIVVTTMGGPVHQAVEQPSKQKPVVSKKSSDGPSLTLYVGNLAFKANRHALAKLFSEHGEVLNARIATDKNTRKPRGYGFVEMPAADALKAMSALNGETFFGRKLNVTEAKDQRSD